MCLKDIMHKDKRNKILDKIGRKGIKVYKVVVEGLDGLHYPVYNKVGHDYAEGINEAIQRPIHLRRGTEYMSGFHFYKTKAAAIRLLKFCRRPREWGNTKVKYKLIQCIVKKSWITQIGYEPGYEPGYGKKLIVIIAKKAIFP